MYVYTILDSSCAANKNISDRAFVQTQNPDNFGINFCARVMLRCSGLKVNHRISDRFA